MQISLFSLFMVVLAQAIWSLSLFVLEYIAKKNPSDPRREGRQDRIKEGRNRKKELVHRYIYSTKNPLYVHYKMCAKILVCIGRSHCIQTKAY